MSSMPAIQKVLVGSTAKKFILKLYGQLKRTNFYDYFDTDKIKMQLKNIYTPYTYKSNEKFFKV